MHRQPRSTFCITNVLNYHRRRRKNTNASNTSNPKKANHHTRNVLIHHRPMAVRISVPNAVIPGMHRGISCPAKKYLCKACKKYGHFTSLCFSKQKKSAYQITAEEIDNHSASEIDETDDSYSHDSFVLYQVRAKINLSKTQDKAPKKMHLIANLPYRLKQYQPHHKCLLVRLDTCADVNIMPRSVYQMMFNDIEVKQLAPNDISFGVYTDHQGHILGKCKFYMLHPDMKKPHAVTLYVASNEGSMLLSCTTLLALDLIQTRPRLNYLPPEQSWSPVLLITQTSQRKQPTSQELQ